MGQGIISTGQLALDFAIEDEFSFRTFVPGAGNREALSALRRLSPGAEAFHFLWGGPGTGKTHLLQALCHGREACAYFPLRRLAGRSPAVLEGLESQALVCLDDVDAVLGGAAWEEGLFALFNTLREQGAALVVSAACAPRALPAVLPDLASRLAWGAAFQLRELDDAGKAEALRLRARGRGFVLGDEVLAYVLQRNPRSMASLFEVLDRLDQLSLVEKRRVTIPFIRDIMGW